MDVLQRAPAAPSDRPVLVAAAGQWTREELRREVDARIPALREEVRPGRVHPATLGGTPADIVEMLAVWQLGGILAPLSPRLSGAERSRAILTLNGAQRDGTLPGGTAVILWTSGTSGRPRGVALSEENLRASVAAARERLDLGPEDTWYASLSVAHVGGLVLIARALLLGSTLVAPGPFSVEGLVGALEAGDGRPAITHLSLVPTQLARLLDAWGEGPPPASLRCILLGGAATPTPLLERALAGGWPISLTYGMTEMTSQVATATPDETRARPGTSGRPLPGTELSFRDDGEILVRGPTQALGYVGDEPTLADSDGWYATGDLGELDEHGNLWIRGRKSDRIISGGVTVDPHEVESALLEHPAIRAACVVGVPDAEWGERVAAAVVPAENDLGTSGVEAWARERLGPARLPRIWREVTRLPTNRNGKVDRAAVRELLERET